MEKVRRIARLDEFTIAVDTLPPRVYKRVIIGINAVISVSIYERYISVSFQISFANSYIKIDSIVVVNSDIHFE